MTSTLTFVCECGRKSISFDIIEYPEEYMELSKFLNSRKLKKLNYSIINKGCRDGEKVIKGTEHLFLVKDKQDER